MSTLTKAESVPSTDVRLPGRLDTPPGRIPFGRLVAVEARKLVDTRSGRWLLIAIGLLTLAVVGIVAFTGKADTDKDFGTFLAATIMPQNFLLPIVGIMAVTTEWSQRTGLVTFVLEPRRPRVAMSKLAAAIGAGLAVVAVGFACAAAFTAITQVVRGSHPDWSITWSLLGAIVLAQVLNIGMGFGFGALIQNTPGAIVTYLFLPIVWSMVASISWMKTVGPWLDTSQTMEPLFEGKMHGDDWAHLGTSMVIWLVIPLALGVWRMVRNEVKSA